MPDIPASLVLYQLPFIIGHYKRELVLHALEGNWHFVRIISEPKAKTYVIGKAQFTAATIENNPILFYREEGEIISNDSPIRVYKEYVYCLEKGNLSVYFANDGKQGGIFHTLKFHDHHEYTTSIRATAFHPCGRDTYNTSYIFHLINQEFEIQHNVKGLHKKYISHTKYRK